MKLIFNLLLLCLLSASCLSQDIKIDTIPFSLEKQLLVFKGKINGSPIDFAFDTGAGVSVANSQNIIDANIKVLKKSRSVQDANQTITKLKNVLMDEIAVGNFKVNNVKGVAFDMPFLKCTNLLLLGQDFINKFNWKIDFSKKVLYLSQTPFLPEPQMLKWPIKYGNNRPHVTLKFDNETTKSCLIDFGYTGILEVDTTIKYFQQSFAAKQALNQGRLLITSNMGLTGLGKPIETKEFMMDSLYLGGTKINKIPVTISGNTDVKIGVQFFNQYCNTVVLNHSQQEYYLLPSNNDFNTKKTFEARVTYKEEKLYITAKSLNPKSTSAQFTINEEVKAVNGRDVKSFANECDFFLWFTFNKDEKFEIEKLNGQKVIIYRTDI